MPQIFILHPAVVFVGSTILFWLCAWIGAWRRRRGGELPDALRDDYGTIQAASLTLLGLIIGFTFSMSISRYDQRKSMEAEEANAIGTETLRLDLLPAGDANAARNVLRDYAAARIQFYLPLSDDAAAALDERTTALQARLWTSVRVPAAREPNPMMALVVAGMNDVINSQGYAQAAWWNRIPTEAWALLLAIGCLCNLMLGYGSRALGARSPLLLILPLLVGISLFLIDDIDTPRRGIIRVQPRNLQSVLVVLDQQVPAKR